MEWGSRDLFTEYWAETIVLLISISCRLNYHPRSISSIQNKIKICSWTLSILWSFQWKKEKPTVFSFSAPITKTADHSMCTMHYIAETEHWKQSNMVHLFIQSDRSPRCTHPFSSLDACMGLLTLGFQNRKKDILHYLWKSHNVEAKAKVKVSRNTL